MMGSPKPTGNDPRRFTTPIKFKLGELADLMREDIEKVDDKQAKALLETGAETIIGLKKAFEDFEMKNEAAWR